MKYLALMFFILMHHASALTEEEINNQANDACVLPELSSEEKMMKLQGQGITSNALFASPEDTATPLEFDELPEPGPESLTVIPPTDITEDHLKAYFSGKAKAFLIDPQNLLSMQEIRDRESFLEYHAEESAVDFYVYVFGAEQIIPEIINSEKIMQQYYESARPAIVVHYFLGNPQRSKVYASSKLRTVVSQQDLDLALSKSVQQALHKSQAIDQLDSFCVQMSIRIYWMEKALQSGVMRVADEMPQNDAEANPSLTAPSPLKKWIFPASLLALTVAAASALNWWRLSLQTYRFPEFEIPPRLGGTHAAGIGAVISYASVKLPPIKQREQVPDYLRRM